MQIKHWATALAISAAGLGFIQQSEGIRYDAYLDSVQVPTICVGSTRKVFLGQRATLQECEERLREDTSRAGKAIGRHVQVRLTQGQYDALLSLVFNIGEGNFARSTLLRKLNAGDCRGAGAEFARWVYAGKVKLRGLVLRRSGERQMFEGGCDAE